MHTLATPNNSPGLKPGFRLHRLEVRNWGTFHEKVHVLDPSGRTALLIGENGSGKSTLVDALLTLLVPKGKRTYNLSAGGTKKKERDEKTYVLGAFGSQSASEESRAQTKFLRKPGDPPSILLAVFKNEVTGESIAVGQLLWAQDDEVRKLFLIARRDRSIQQDFVGLGESRTWKKAFRSKGFEVEDSFGPYAEKIVRYLQMESMTTLALFSQTVAIKEITHVSGFIRDHMLERLDSRELIDGLEHHYQDLKACWEAICTAKEQLKMLAPIVEKAVEIAACDAKIAESNGLRDVLPACFAGRVKVLLEIERSSLEAEMGALGDHIHRLAASLEVLNGQTFGLRQAIDNDEVGKQLTRVRAELAGELQAERDRRSASADYQKCLAALGVTDEVSQERQFDERQAWAADEQKRQTELLSSAATDRATAEQEFKRLQAEHREVENELRSLRQRPDLIPEAQRRLRLYIAQGAGVEVVDLPFAGELMDVKPAFQADWRGALERLLRGFGLSLLVPDDLYSPVNHFINDNNLRGRMVYHLVPRHGLSHAPSHDKGRVIERIQLKTGHSMCDWVEGELRARFNYRCCESIEEFEAASGFALTKQGLIRGAGTRHVKDDTAPISDPRNHILGWSNREKVERLEEELRGLAAAGQKQADMIIAARRRQATATARTNQAALLMGYRQFFAIDWRSAEGRRIELERQKSELERSSDKIKQLQEQLTRIEADMRAQDAMKTEIVGQRGGLESRLGGADRRLAECVAVLATVQDVDLAEFDEAVSALLSGTVLSISNAWEVQHRTEKLVANDLLELERQRSRVVESATRAMGAFVGKFKELTDLFAGEEFIPDFLKLEEGLRLDDLPRYDQRFQDLMSRDVLVHVVKFQDTLEDHCSEMQIKIDHLNGALKSITYSPRTYITIRVAQTTDADIRLFRGRLKSCLEHGLAPNGADRESAFQRISELIDLFRSKPDWAAKVTDARNWLAFAVEERDRETGRQENIYEDTSGKSGGQKAKLAFTILASAVAYQYGIAKDRQNPDSFRFVVVDEMFSRSDETNSRYAMQLFEQFHLQLLIVCPFDARARVVEPFVSSYHLTLNPTTQCSTVRTVSVEEVREHLARQIPMQPADANS